MDMVDSGFLRFNERVAIVRVCVALCELEEDIILEKRNKKSVEFILHC